MDWIAIGLGLLTTGALVVYITRPWWIQRWQPQTQPDSTPDTSLADQREATLTALRDLDFDHTMGKVTEKDYASLRQTLLAEAAAIMTQIEQEQVAAQTDLDARIEAKILAARQNLNGRQASRSPTTNGRTCPTCSRAPLPGDLYCRGCGTQLAPTCPECGKVVTPTDHFCVGCGFELALAVAG
ncbi:MAG: hypothetical protein GTN46_02995 [Gammaproteobacteria bacterium]|nr:hypothetical protein [Gammaproteobacteria bacterium]